MEKKYKFSTTIPMVIGQLIVIYRKKIGKSQKDLANALEVGGANASKIEAGDTVISVEQLFIICLFLKEKPSNFFLKLEKALKILDENGILVSNTKIKDLSIDKEHKTTTLGGAALGIAGATGGLLGPLSLLGTIGLAAGAVATAYKTYNDLSKNEEVQQIELPIIQGDQLYTYLIQAFS
ncbi:MULTISPECIES: helix-turn-helix domain-containing protein [unclassified Acinetobacter]|uniref:helix-turn-helix domain-containing protein n=1 Tax=unclassified Acinetobacter TaxID=196816 RepID=UPI0025C5D665|nr:MULTISPECIES: helix-turn-helix transcriptional regulator [unclassified Acinetobacter]